MLYNSPLEQFTISPIIAFFLNNSPFVLDNNLVYLPIPFLFYCGVLVSLYFESGPIKGYSLTKRPGLPTLLAIYIEFIRKLCVSVLGPVRGVHMHSFFCSLFSFVFTFNFLGLMPYAFPVNAQLSSVFSLSFALIVGVCFIMFNQNGLRSFAVFLPEGTPFFLIPFVVPLEIFAFFLRFFSLPGRLFANIMSGHVLLKVFAGLASALLATKTFFGLCCSFIPLLLLFFLFFLEIVIAFVQSYVFCLLVLIFLSDAYRLH